MPKCAPVKNESEAYSELNRTSKMAKIDGQN